MGLGAIPGGWDLANDYAHNNTIKLPVGVSNAIGSVLKAGSICTSTQAWAYTKGSKNLRFNFNTRYVSSLSGRWWFWGAYKTWAEWQTLGAETGGPGC